MTVITRASTTMITTQSPATTPIGGDDDTQARTLLITTQSPDTAPDGGDGDYSSQDPCNCDCAKVAPRPSRWRVVACLVLPLPSRTGRHFLPSCQHIPRLLQLRYHVLSAYTMNINKIDKICTTFKCLRQVWTLHQRGLLNFKTIKPITGLLCGLVEWAERKYCQNICFDHLFNE